MDNDRRGFARSKSQTVLKPGRSMPALKRYASLVVRSTSEGGIANPMCQIAEENSSVCIEDGNEERLSVIIEEVLETDSGSSCSSLTRPLASGSTNMVRGSKLRSSIKKAIAGASSMPNIDGQYFKGKCSLPGPGGFQNSWKEMEHYLRQQAVDTVPESQKRKPFHRRTWFTCTINIIVLALILAGILAVACARTVIIPMMFMNGEVSERPPPIIESDPVAYNLLRGKSTDDTVPTINKSRHEDLNELLWDHATNNSRLTVQEEPTSDNVNSSVETEALLQEIVAESLAVKNRSLAPRENQISSDLQQVWMTDNTNAMPTANPHSKETLELREPPSDSDHVMYSVLGTSDLQNVPIINKTTIVRKSDTASLENIPEPLELNITTDKSAAYQPENTTSDLQQVQIPENINSADVDLYEGPSLHELVWNATATSLSDIEAPTADSLVRNSSKSNTIEDSSQVLLQRRINLYYLLSLPGPLQWLSSDQGSR